MNVPSTAAGSFFQNYFANPLVAEWWAVTLITLVILEGMARKYLLKMVLKPKPQA